MPGEFPRGYGNQNIDTNSTAAAWEAVMAGVNKTHEAMAQLVPKLEAPRYEMPEEVSVQQESGVVENASGHESLETWEKTLEGTPEEYWQKLQNERLNKGVVLGDMPDLTRTNEVIEHFFENGVVGVTGEGRALREEMAQKAVLNDIAKMEERRGGGDLDDEAMREIFLKTQNTLDAMYRGNRGLREDARENEQLTDDEKIAWRLHMEMDKAKWNPLVAMQNHTRKPDETSEAYEARLRNYVEDTKAHRDQMEAESAYGKTHPEEVKVYAEHVAWNKDGEDLPEFSYLKWNEDENVETVGSQPEREGRIKQLFEKVRGKVSFRKVVDKVMMKVAQAVVATTAWAEAKLREDESGATEDEQTEAVVEVPAVKEETAVAGEEEPEPGVVEAETTEEVSSVEPEVKLTDVEKQYWKGEIQKVVDQAIWAREARFSAVNDAMRDRAKANEKIAKNKVARMEAETGLKAVWPEEVLKAKYADLEEVQRELERRLQETTDPERLANVLSMGAQVEAEMRKIEVTQEFMHYGEEEETEEASGEQEVAVEEEKDEFQPRDDMIKDAGEYAIWNLKTNGVIPQDSEPTIEDLKALQEKAKAEMVAARTRRDRATEEHYAAQMDEVYRALVYLRREEALRVQAEAQANEGAEAEAEGAGTEVEAGVEIEEQAA